VFYWEKARLRFVWLINFFSQSKTGSKRLKKHLCDHVHVWTEKVGKVCSWETSSTVSTQTDRGWNSWSPSRTSPWTRLVPPYPKTEVLSVELSRRGWSLIYNRISVNIQGSFFHKHWPVCTCHASYMLSPVLLVLLMTSHLIVILFVIDLHLFIHSFVISFCFLWCILVLYPLLLCNRDMRRTQLQNLSACSLILTRTWGLFVYNRN